MPTVVTLNGTSYNIPLVGEANWGAQVSAYLVALSTGVLTKAGGSFTLTADVDFGATYGLKATKFSSRTTPATTGIVRLGNAEYVSWRNAGNTADLGLRVNASNVLEYNGAPIVTLALGAANTALVMNSGATAYQWSAIVNANIDAAAAITRTKLANGASGEVVVNDGGGVMTSIAQLDGVRGGTGVNNGTGTLTWGSNALTFTLSGATNVTLPTSGTLFGNPMTTAGDLIVGGASGTPARRPLGTADQVFIVSGGTAVWGQIVDAGISAAAAITRTKLASGSANHVLINDGTGDVSSEAQLAGSRGGSGVSNSGTFTWGSNNITFTTSGATSLTLPTSGTLVTTNASQTLTLKTYDSPIFSGTGTSGNAFVQRYYDSDGSHYTGLKANATTTASLDYSLPAAGPASDGQVLACTTLGVMSWTSPFVNPMTNAGEIVYGGVGGTATALAAGTSGYVLQSGGSGAPSWVNKTFLAGGTTAAPTYSFAGDTSTGVSAQTAGRAILSGGGANNTVEIDSTSFRASVGGTTRVTASTSAVTLALPTIISGVPDATVGMLQVKADSGQKGYVVWSEAATNRWSLGFESGSNNFSFRTGAVTGTLVGTIGLAGNWTFGPNPLSGSGVVIGKNSTAAASSTDRVFDAQFSVDTDCTGGYFYTCLNQGGSVIGRIEAATNTTTTFTGSSDQRLKQNPSDFDALEIIAQIIPREFEWKANPGVRNIGFYAQELHEVFPEAVSVGSDELTESGELKYPWGVDYSRLTPILVKALQELKAQFDAYVAAHP
jgi:hypothetical protein